ncbi:hypothetical protein JCM8547_000808 [Rhodosporidiobolus lusitaniae]
MAAPPRPAPPSTYGLATQLRTPPMDSTPFSPTTTDSSVRSTQKTPPAMRDDGKNASPRLFTMPQWKESSPRTGSNDGHSMGSPHSARSGMDGSGWQGDEAGVRGYSAQVKKSLHNRTRSSPQAPAGNRFKTDSPHRPPRPDSPAREKTTTPLPPPIPRPTETTATGAPVFGDFSFSSGQPLDLGIKLDPVYSTYRASQSNPKDASPGNIASPAKSDDANDTPYAAQVRVSVAQRVERAPSFRKGSLAELNLDHLRRGSQATTNSSRSSLLQRDNSNDGTGLSAPQLRQPRAPSPGGTTRPIGQGLRSSYAGSTTSSNGGAAPIVFRRASSVYVPNPSPGPSVPLSLNATSSGLVPTPGPTPQSAILPGSKLPLNLLTLARRTAHISDVPGYAWRLNLLEKLELIMGSFLTVADAEAILSIGNGPEKRKTNRLESRKSQIGLPQSYQAESPKLKQKAKAPESKGFLGRMKRALSSSGGHIPKETPPPLPTSKKAVFGVPLQQVAEYGFVTSMIAGQRHDLPGVTFSTVEEIYRRGQGSKVPGLMQLQGEPGRVAKLIQIYDTPPDYGEHHDLSIESIHNVTSLLKRYLRDLPEPVLDQRLWRLYIAACVDSPNPPKSRIACAQIILRLLPTPNFSLLVYLVAFLSQMPLFPENKLSLESVSSIFGSSIMAPRPSMEKKQTRGEMVITGPTESFEAIGETIKKGQEALLWLLNHWSSVADGLLEPEFDIDPNTVLEKHHSNSTLNVELPPTYPNLTNQPPPPIPQHLQKPAQPPAPAPAPVAPPRPQHPPQYQEPMSVEEELRSWAPQKPLSPAIEQRTLEISSAEQFNDVRQSYDSPPASPRANGLYAPAGSSRRSPLVDRAVSPSSSRSHGSPYVQQQRTPRATQQEQLRSPDTPSVYEMEDSGPPTPSKEDVPPFFSSASNQKLLPLPSQQQHQHALPAPPMHDDEEEEEQDKQLDQAVGEEDDEERDDDDNESIRAAPVAPHHDDEHGRVRAASDSSPSVGNSEEPPHMEPSSSASSERSASVITPRESQRPHSEVEGLRKSVASGQGEYRLSNGPNGSVLDDLLDYDDNASVYSFPSPPLSLPTRPSPFLPPSPFLTQEEINAALAANSQRELDSLPPPANPADYANSSSSEQHERGTKPAPVLEEKLFTGSAPPAIVSSEDLSPGSVVAPTPVRMGSGLDKLLVSAASTAEDLKRSSTPIPPPPPAGPPDNDAQEEELEDNGPPVPHKSPKHVPARLSSSSSARRGSDDSTRGGSAGRGHQRSQSAQVASGSGPAPWPAPTPRSPVNIAEFESKRLSLPSSAAPGNVPAALLRSTEEQLVSAQAAAEEHRKEVQKLWKNLTELENERVEERRELKELKKEVEGFKERMGKRRSAGEALLRVQLDQEKKKVEEEGKGRKEAEEDARKAREELELLRMEMATFRAEAKEAREEVGEVKGELKKVEELREKEQVDARATIEALEAQLSSIRAVLLGGAGIKI